MNETPTIRECGTEDFLHRFFSPYRVPAGLLEREIQACIKLCQRKAAVNKRILRIQAGKRSIELTEALEADYTLLEQWRIAFSILFGEQAFSMSATDLAGAISEAETLSTYPAHLPPELLENPMTRESFSRGIAILTSRIDLLESML